MGAADRLTILVSANIDRSVYDMFDIAESIDKIIALVPDYDKRVACAIKDGICDKMAGWLDAEI